MSQARIDFIKKHAQEVVNATSGTGLFASVAMAQMIIESADKNGVAGNGITALKANNYFGIKADSSWTGKKMSFNTPNDVAGGGQKVSYFRVYDSPQDSVADHTAFLQKFPRYKDVFTAKNPQEQAERIEKAGYAGKAPNAYSRDIKKVIADYNLESLDKLQASLTDGKKKIVSMIKSQGKALGFLIVVFTFAGGLYLILKK